MVGNLIGGVIAILIGISLFGTISQEMHNVMNCIPSNITNGSQYYGETNSFGGGGSEHFGGYDGEVRTRNFMAELAPYKTEKSILNPDCKKVTGATKTMLTILPWFFALAILGIAIQMVYGALVDSGLIAGPGNEI